MRKAIFFVEGQTEQLFIEAFMAGICARNKVKFRCLKLSGGGRSGKPAKVEVLNSTTNHDDGNHSFEYLVTIIDVSADNRVLSSVLDQYQSILASGDYFLIVGLQDYYPSKLPIEDYKYLLRSRLPNNLQLDKIPVTDRCIVDLVIAVAEIEAWFIADKYHFNIYLPNFKPEMLLDNDVFDPFNQDPNLVRQLKHPAKELDKIYRLAGKFYKKDRSVVQALVKSLNIPYMYDVLAPQIPELSHLARLVDHFVGHPS